MSALLDEFRSVLSSYRAEVATWVNQGFIVSIDEHLKRLEAAAPTVEADARAAVHQVLTDLYTAWHAPAQDAPAAPQEPATAPVEEPAPVLATGGTVSEPVLIGESGPEILTLPDGAPVVSAAAGAEDVQEQPEPASETAPAEQDAAPAADTAAPTES